jgi:hypothetical protein
LTLVACGGGGGEVTQAGPVVSTLSFPFASAVKSDNATGTSITLTAKGTAATESTDGLCSGTRTVVGGTPSGGASFDGAPAFSASGTTTTNWTNCTPSSNVSTATAYFDSNYVFLGAVAQDGSFLVRPSGFITPTTVRVNDVFIGGTDYMYTDTTKTVGDGHRDVSLVVEPDTADTAIVNTIYKYYNAYQVSNGVILKDGKLSLTAQYRSRISSTGALSPISIDLQYYNTTASTQHRYIFRR